MTDRTDADIARDEQAREHAHAADDAAVEAAQDADRDADRDAANDVLLNALDRYARAVGIMGLDDDVLLDAANAAVYVLATR